MIDLALAGILTVSTPACASLQPTPPMPPVSGRIAGRAEPPHGDALGDAWEMEEVSCWRGTWLRRGQSRVFDGYWTHPDGERVRAELEMWLAGRSVIVVRRHPGGKYCRYDGLISADWWSVEGRYTCTWERTPMPWRAQIVRMSYSTPALLRN